MRKTQILRNKPVYSGLLIFDRSKIVMYEFCYDYVNSKYGEELKLFYIDKQFHHIHKNRLYL